MDDHYRTLEDFLLDDYFVDWVNRPSSASDRFWSEWQRVHPHRQSLLEQARRIVLAAHNEPTELSEEEVSTMWQQLQRRHRDTARQPTRIFPIWVAAACLVGILLGGIGWLGWYTEWGVVTYQTAYGETKAIVLPDSSTVILNANSTLTHQADWKDYPDRTVTLTGEAFFTVRHVRDHRKFLVQTPTVVVEVVGTAFNVHHRRGRAQIALREGKVTLRQNTLAQPQDITMQPGDLVDVADTGYTQKQVDVAQRISWTNNELVFDGTTLAEIAQLLEDNYGLTVRLADPTLASKQFRGRAPADDPENLMKQLQKVFQLTIERQRNHITLRPRRP